MAKKPKIKEIKSKVKIIEKKQEEKSLESSVSESSSGFSQFGPSSRRNTGLSVGAVGSQVSNDEVPVSRVNNVEQTEEVRYNSRRAYEDTSSKYNPTLANSALPESRLSQSSASATIGQSRSSSALSNETSTLRNAGRDDGITRLSEDDSVGKDYESSKMKVKRRDELY